jgi:glycosyltransferase involved in cell wall biosynthesis
MKKLLFIAPLPPPVTGQSIISGALYAELEKHYKVIPFNYTRKDVKADAGFRPSRISGILSLARSLGKEKGAQLVYFTISQSMFGNLKDLYFLWKMGRKLRRRTVIHLHGGHFDTWFKSAPFIIKFLNRIMFKEVATGIVLSNSLRRCLRPLLPDERIREVPNFIDSNLVIKEAALADKWQKNKPLNLLFLSNFIREKGYRELLEAFVILPEEVRKRYRLHLAGKFENSVDEQAFLGLIHGSTDILYHGVVSGEKKRKLLHDSHLFVLPSYYPVEGQPVSILEAYASGSVVVTTDQGGIPDIFTDGENGFQVEKKSVPALSDVLLRVAEIDRELLQRKARANLLKSRKYTIQTFVDSIVAILDSIE